MHLEKVGQWSAQPGLQVIGIDFRVSKQERLTGWLLAPALRFHRHEDDINLRMRLRIGSLLSHR